MRVTLELTLISHPLGDKMILPATNYQMIDIANKQSTQRIAIAKGRIHVGNSAFDLIAKRQLPKGDALMLAEIAGIQGAKMAFQSIPLCHPLNLDNVSIKTRLDSDANSIHVYCRASAFAKTGVEMEALAGVNAALLCIYDLAKMIEPALCLSDIRLLIKQGGKNGIWIHPDGIPEEVEQMFNLIPSHDLTHKHKGIKATIIKISDRASQGIYEDAGDLKQLLQDKLIALGMEVHDYHIIPNECEQISRQILSIMESNAPDLIITTGGTGISSRDTTPETVVKLCDRLIPGLSELLRLEGAKYNPNAWLSRCIVGMIKNTLIITLPGRPKAVHESINILGKILPHALDNVTRESHDHL